jgi:WD40 repeat protein
MPQLSKSGKTVRKNRILHCCYVLITRDTVVINPEAQVWLDAAELEAKLAEAQDPAVRITPEMAAQIEEAVDLYRGDFLRGFYVRDSAAFEDWMGRERERFHRLVVGALPRLVAHCLEVGDYPAGMRHAARLLELDPLMEDAHRQMMRLLAYSGQRGAALEQYETCRAILERELGVEPVAETTALYEHIVAGKVGPPAAVLAEEEEIPPAPGEPPFKGLQFFDVADADLFFGREMLTARLVERLREERLLAVVGASGSGKSSLVRAGLVPALQRGQPLADGTQLPQGSERWEVHILTPTAHPLEALALSLTRGADSAQATTTLTDDLAADPRSLHVHVRKRIARGNRLLLVVDQFEELFALCRDAEERRAFVDNLLTAADPQVGGPTVVVLTLRADFYHHCAQYDNLREALGNYQEYIGSMTPQELRRAIEEPARQNDWEFEPGLVGLLLHDVGDEPGALPLLSHALLETWKRRRGRMMTLSGYTGAGRVQSAIAQSAEAIYQGLEEHEQAIARSIFLRLTELGEGTQDTRRQAGLDELVTRPDEATAVEGVLSTLVEARLVTAEEETVQVAHEALIREWPTLREWLDEDREGLRVHRHLTEAAQEWQRMGRDPGELYRGGRLAQASEWASAHSEALNPLEREFLAASEDWAQRREAEREAQRQRELEAARKLAEAERQRAEERERSAVGMRRRARYLAGALVIAGALAIVAFLLSQRASRNAETAESERAVAEAARVQEAAQRATAQASQAQEAAQRVVAETAQAQEAEQRAVAEVARVEADEQGEEALRQASIGLGAQALLALEGVSSESAVLLALEALENYPYTWQAERALGMAVLGSRVRMILQHEDRVNCARWSPDGTRILTAGFDDTEIKVWDATTGEELLALSDPEDVVMIAAWSPSGDRILAGSWDGMVGVWDAITGEELLQIAGHSDMVNSASWAPDGTRFLTTSDDGLTKIWDAITSEMLMVIESPSWVQTGVWSPLGDRILTGSGDGIARVWDAVTGDLLLTLSGHTAAVWEAAWSPDGSRIATGSSDYTVKVWDATTGAEIFTLSGHTMGLLAVAWSPDGSRILTGSDDNDVKVWDATTGEEIITLSGHTGWPMGVAWSPSDDRILTASWDGTVKVWDLDPAFLTIAGAPGNGRRVAWSPQGDQIAQAFSDGTAKVWDVVTGEELLTLSGHDEGIVLSAIWSPSGDRILTSSHEDGTAKVWNADTGDLLFTLPGHWSAFYALWSPDGSRIVTGGEDEEGTAKVWDADTGQLLLTLAGHEEEYNVVYNAAWSPDGARIVTGDWQGNARIWNAATGQLIRDLLPESFTFIVWRVAWSPDGKRIVTYADDAVGRVWDATTGEELVTFAGHTGSATQMAWSRTSDRILTSSMDGTARVWDATNGVELLRYDVRSVAFADWSPDGKRIVIAVDNGTLKVFPAWQTLQELIDYAKECWVIRELTAEERVQFGLPLR